MIEINLLPQDLKVKAKAKKAAVGVGIDVKYFLYLVPFIFGLLLCVHIYLAIVNIAKSSQLRALNNKWQGLQPQRKILEDFNKEYTILSEDALAIQQFTKQRINWAEKLNTISAVLPFGIWFREISVSSSDLILQGSVVSLEKEEMSVINKLIDSLKKDTAFFKDFNNLELGSVQKRTIGGYDIADFILQGALLKSK